MDKPYDWMRYEQWEVRIACGNEEYFDQRRVILRGHYSDQEAELITDILNKEFALIRAEIEEKFEAQMQEDNRYSQLIDKLYEKKKS